jgi:3-oxoacyl-[acyl-carrier-protein] synthase-3
MVRTSLRALEKASLSVDEIDWWVPHQANARLIEAARAGLQIPPEKVLISLDRCGNSSAATIPLTLSQHWRERGIPRAGTYLLTAVGAGFTEAAAVYRTAAAAVDASLEML